MSDQSQSIDPITDQFSKIWGMVSPSKKSAGGSGGAGMSPGVGIKSEPIEGNSLTQFLRSTFNLLGDQGTGTMAEGKGIIGAGLNALQQPFDYYSAILSGDKTAIGKAIGPISNIIDKQYEHATQASEHNMARGGYRSATLANLPFEKAGKISDAILQQQGSAAEHLTQISQILSSIGLSQEQVSTALLQLMTSGQLSMRGQDVQESGNVMGMIGGIGQGVGSLIGGIIAHGGK